MEYIIFIGAMWLFYVLLKGDNSGSGHNIDGMDPRDNDYDDY